MAHSLLSNMNLDDALRDPDHAPLSNDPAAPDVIATRISAIRTARSELAAHHTTPETLVVVRAALEQNGMLSSNVIDSFCTALAERQPLDRAALRSAARLADEALRGQDASLCRFAKRFPSSQAMQMRLLLATAGADVDPLDMQAPAPALSPAAASAAEALTSADPSKRGATLQQLGRKR